MNITKAYLFQRIGEDFNIMMVWENADITRMFDMVNTGMYKYIGWVSYDTIEHRLVG